MKAIWNGVLIAQSDNTKIVEGNHYFPVASIHNEFFQPSDNHSYCHWKGQASYYNVEVNGLMNMNAAWYYPKPSGLAEGIKDHVAFWKGIEITK